MAGPCDAATASALLLWEEAVRPKSLLGCSDKRCEGRAGREPTQTLPKRLDNRRLRPRSGDLGRERLQVREVVFLLFVRKVGVVHCPCQRRDLRGQPGLLLRNVVVVTDDCDAAEALCIGHGYRSPSGAFPVPTCGRD